jgi:hypothetical protein
MPRSFRLPSEKDELWTNYQLDETAKRGFVFLWYLARLKSGLTIEQAQIEVNEIGRRIEQANPTFYSDLTLPLVPLRESIVGDVRPALLVMFGAVLFVLLIAVVNIANLLLGRPASRDREIAVRRNLGAGRIRIALQLLTENILLVLVGGVLGLVLAYCGVQFVRAWNPGNLPRTDDIGLDVMVVAFTCLVTRSAGVLFSLVPAFEGSGLAVNATLKESGRCGAFNRTRRGVQSMPAVAEVALSAVLLVGAGLLLHSFVRLETVDAGFHATGQTS